MVIQTSVGLLIRPGLLQHLVQVWRFSITALCNQNIDCVESFEHCVVSLTPSTIPKQKQYPDVYLMSQM
jgi:hypothetical protein